MTNTRSLRYFVWAENKEQENFDETPKFVFDTLYAYAASSGSKSRGIYIYSSEAAKIPYQVNNSDRIVIGTVSEINVADYYTNNTITVREWLYNPLPTKTIIVRTNMGSNVWVEDEAEFTKNESVLLMLKDQRADKGVFHMSLGFLGKHPVSDRNAVIEVLKTQDKWKEEDQTVNKTNDTGTTEKAGTLGKQNGESNTSQKSNTTPFMSTVSVIAVMLGTVIYIRKKQ